MKPASFPQHGVIATHVQLVDLMDGGGAKDAPWCWNNINMR